MEEQGRVRGGEKKSKRRTIDESAAQRPVSIRRIEMEKRIAVNAQRSVAATKTIQDEAEIVIGRCRNSKLQGTLELTLDDDGSRRNAPKTTTGV